MIQSVDVSIIIVSYNILNVLDNCIKSVSKYSRGFTYEIIVVDNNSTEGLVTNVTEKYDSVRLIQNDFNRGFAAANNQGLQIARGKYVLFLNNDTVFLENTICKILEFCEKSSLVKQHDNYFLGCKLLNNDGSHQISLCQYDTVWNSFTENFFLYKLFPKSKLFNKFYYNYINIEVPAEVEVIKGAFIFAPIETVKKLGGFDERFFFYWEETDLCYRLKNIGGCIIYYPCTSVIHLGGVSSGEVPWFVYKNQGMSKVQFYQKHFTGIQYILAVTFHYIGLLLRIPLYLSGGIIMAKKSLLCKALYYIRQLFNYPSNQFRNKSITEL